jgi:hypothetical protein
MMAANTLVREMCDFMGVFLLRRIGMGANLPLGRDEDEFGSKA